MSPISQCANAFDLNESLRESSRQFFLEGSRPSGVLTLHEDATPAQVNAFREDWKNTQTSVGGVDPGRMHRIAVLSGEMKFQPISFSMADQEFLASREFSTREIAAVFGLPSWAINGSSGDSLTYSNVTSQLLFLVNHSFRPITARSKQRSLPIRVCALGGPTPRSTSRSCCAPIPHNAPSSTPRRSAIAGTPGWMTRSEVREQEDLPPEEERPRRCCRRRLLLWLHRRRCRRRRT